MNLILVPTDFSDASKNAAFYAAGMLNGKPGKELVLYYVHLGSIDDEDLQSHSVGSAEVSLMKQAMEVFKTELEAVSDVSIRTVVQAGDAVAPRIQAFAKHEGVDLIVMGITGASKLEQWVIGSNTLKMVEDGACPVMIIPPDAKYQEIRNVGFTSDFKDVEHTTPFAPIQKFLRLFNPGLYIINVDTEHYVEITDAYKKERNKLEEHFAAFKPEFAFMRLYDFPEAISLFAKDKELNCIITVPKRHNFWQSLFRSSTTKKLVYHSDVPIIAIHA